VARRTCNFVKDDGGSCGAAPLHESDFCFVHAPEYAEEMAEARRLGGLRRRRERTVAGAYDFEGLETVGQLRRLLSIATVDSLSLENSIARSRVLVAIVLAGSKLLEVGELQQRIEALEGALGPRLHAASGRKR